MAEDERRANPRFVCELRASVGLLDGRVLRGDTCDLSRGGLLVMLEESIEEGTPVMVALTIGLGWSEADFLRLPSNVVRSQKIDGGHATGLVFEALDADTSKRLDLLVRVLDGELDFLADVRHLH